MRTMMIFKLETIREEYKVKIAEADEKEKDIVRNDMNVNMTEVLDSVHLMKLFTKILPLSFHNYILYYENYVSILIYI